MLIALFTLGVLATTAPEAAAPAAPITGAASPLLASFCVPAGEEGDVLRCAGLVGTDVYLRGEETGRTVSLGAPPAFFPPFPTPSILGKTLSWRILGDRPLAGILRYRFPGGAAGADIAVRAVVKAAWQARPGCLVAIVEDDGTDAATAAAERIADAQAAGFRCGVDRPSFEGRGSDFTQRVIRPWLDSQTP